MLVPDANQKRYCLFLESDRDTTHGWAEDDHSPLVKRLDQLLCENTYYRQARELGQLHAATIVQEKSKGSFIERYQQLCRRHGIRAGGIKLVALETNPQRAREFLARD